MYPFISLLWDASDPEPAAVARRLLATIHTALPEYRLALNEDGCIVLHNPPSGNAFRLYPLKGPAGVILGRIFPVAPGDWTDGWSWSPTVSETTEIVRTRGKWLTRHMWGGYVAFLRDPATATASVIRDCSGRLPCYHLRYFQIDLFFADPAVLCSLGLVPVSINWNYMRAFLCSSQLQIRDTALEGVSELLAGDCFHRPSAANSARYFAWTPKEILERSLIHDFNSAVRTVRPIASYCIRAWSSVFGNILHRLSGGLDSSVVLGCLAQCRSPETVVCVNHYGSHVSEDERTFARLAAARANIPLVEVPVLSDAQHIDESLTHIPLTAKPTVSGTIGTLEMFPIRQMADEFRASSIWTGQGGDHLFLQASLPFGPIDYAALRGLGLGLLKPMHDAVHLSRWNYWAAASLLWKNTATFSAIALGTVPIGNSPFITADARSRISQETLLHPWTHEAELLPIGQRFQIAALSQVLNRHRPLPRIEATPQHHPLLSQPLIELCLRIPSYVHLRGGIDRAVERAAFADLLPGEVVASRQKGQTTFSVLELLHRSRAFIRDLLLEGILVKNDVLDRIALEPYLNGHRPTDATTLWPLLSSVAAELWVRSWQNALGSTSQSCNCQGRSPN